MRDLYLAIDVGTGGLRSALVGRDGRILAFAHREHEQIVPQFGWSEQRPADWWRGTQETIRAVLADVKGSAERVAAICTCGQMHGTVLVDGDGRLTRQTTPLWNDKRTAPQVTAFADRNGQGAYLDIAANMPATAWPAFKLAWIAENDPQAMARTAAVLMPKDWINLCLTGILAQDRTEASLSFLMDWRSRDWSDDLCRLTGIDPALLPPLHDAGDILGPLLPKVGQSLGLDAGIPVLVGAGDYPMALLGSGVIGPGMGSDVTGTSTIITLTHDAPVIDPEISNVLSAGGDWGAMTLLDAGGDAVRWARRAFHDNDRSYARIAEDAAQAAVGSDALFFLPYLSGERFNPRSRAQFFGLTASHGLPELHRAVLEGVAFSVRQRLDGLQGGQGRPERIVAASGGAKNALWLKIKASMYGVPYLVPEELECGVVGAATLMAVATGDSPDLNAAAAQMVRFADEVQPDPAWAEVYDRMMPVYARLYDSAQEILADMDGLV
ncbi:xylulokinase [Sagittula stellata]|uniref:Putative pentose kinase protein n=1 Tax=Sagittula stellata (strain ATCC 700073 / DSM 11524 / E-37) TaxID=388399 RepID=A3K9G3_SAGS3|nr:FGGY-family carbohydrate kinase [Sagittula stellata]EBA06107.1 putative pentose kinase protein [Sagittula stellata E-37]